MIEMEIIARIRSPFPEKFGVPRQSGLVESLQAQIVFEEGFHNADAVRGLEGFSHIWLIWQFSRAWGGMVAYGAAARLGGMSAWACLPPVRPFVPCHRPFLVKLERIELDSRWVRCPLSGAESDGRHPDFDINPICLFDSHPEAQAAGRTRRAPPTAGDVSTGSCWRRCRRAARGLLGVLAAIPAAAIKRTQAGTASRFGDVNVKFTVSGAELHTGSGVIR